MNKRSAKKRPSVNNNTAEQYTKYKGPADVDSRDPSALGSLSLSLVKDQLIAKMSVRHDWYQSDAKVVVTVMLKNPKEKNYKVEIKPQHLNMIADGYELNLRLYAPVNVERSSYKDYPSKVEITLAKETGLRWEALEAKKETAAHALIALPPMHKKNWDTLAKELEKKEEEEAQSEEALQRLFKKIYSSSSPEVQKAMNKSFSESGGTVLSTNWNEVSKQPVEVKPPEGTEFKKWDEV
uniref:CS domain-containing protein n=1 Tax=Glossina brevipalpis TaxID=37001 RepID=A0A1A9W9L0_9MUSC